MLHSYYCQVQVNRVGLLVAMVSESLAYKTLKLAAKVA